MPEPTITNAKDTTSRRGMGPPDLADCFLVAVTERRTKEQIDALADALATA